MPMCVRRRGWTRAHESSGGVTGSTEVREAGDQTFSGRQDSRAAARGRRTNSGGDDRRDGMLGADGVQDEAPRHTTMHANRCLQPVSNPARTHSFWTELARGLLALAALIAWALSLVAMVE